MTDIDLDRSLQPHWRTKSINMFIDAFKRYKEVLQPHADPRNTKTVKEIERTERLIEYLQERADEGDDELDLIQVLLEKETYAKLYDLMNKYWSYKRQLLEEKKRKVTYVGATEGDEREYEEIREILQAPIFSAIEKAGLRPANRILVNDLFLPNPPTTHETPPLNQVFNIDKFNGNLAGVNHGTQVYNDQEAVLVAIEKMATLLEKKLLTDQTYAQALHDLLVLQSETLKKDPDKTIVQKALDGLSGISALTTIGSFLLQYGPIMHQLKDSCVQYFQLARVTA